LGIDDPGGLRLRVQFRHVMSDIPGTIKRYAEWLSNFKLSPLNSFLFREDNGDIVVTFDKRQKAVAPGQIAAVWDENMCLGSGTIIRVHLLAG
jgi:tRNA-5-taurinomethyluridine 2-sulfurtransferase